MNLKSSMNSKKTRERQEMKKADSKKEKKIFRDANPKMESVKVICCKNYKPDNVQRKITS